MKILMVKMDPPFPLESGTDWVSYHLLKTLLAEHEITYATLTRSTREEQAVDELKRLGARVVAMRQPNTRSVFHRLAYKVWYLFLTLCTGVPMIVWYNTPWPMRRRIRRLLAEEAFDLVHVEYWYATPYARHAPKGRRVLLKHDVAWVADRRLLDRSPRGPGRWWAEKNAERRRRAELRFCREFDTILTLTGADRDTFRAMLGDNPPVKALPAVVLPFDAEPVRAREDHTGTPKSGCRIMFVGHLGRAMVVDALTWFCDDILPAVQRECPEAEFEIVGARRDRVQHLAGRPGILLTGFVDDVKSRLRDAFVMVVPLRAGSGIKIKIVEAMMAGTAIVTTSIGAEGIEATHNRELMIADDPGDFARCVLELLRDPERRARMGEAAQDFARARYASEEARRAVLDFYRTELNPGGEGNAGASARESEQGVSQAGV